MLLSIAYNNRPVNLIKHLALLRHADTEPAFAEGSDDTWRKLTGTGMRQCQDIARHIEELRFDLALCSPSRRTLDTAKLALAGRYAKLVSSDPLYNASAPQLIERIARLEETLTSVIVIAHNPGISNCAALLASGTATPPRTMMPGTLITFTFVGKWQEIGKGSCHLDDVFIPSDIPQAPAAL